MGGVVIIFAVLLLGAALIGFWVWMRYRSARDLKDLARSVRFYDAATDEWEKPRIVQGVYDGEDDFRD